MWLIRIVVEVIELVADETFCLHKGAGSWWRLPYRWSDKKGQVTHAEHFLYIQAGKSESNLEHG